MTRILLNRATGALLPYPREDNEPVVGLDRDAAYVVEVVREPEPEYDSATHYLQHAPGSNSISRCPRPVIDY
jgi:hypothetical protein